MSGRVAVDEGEDPRHRGGVLIPTLVEGEVVRRRRTGARPRSVEHGKGRAMRGAGPTGQLATVPPYGPRPTSTSRPS